MKTVNELITKYEAAVAETQQLSFVALEESKVSETEQTVGVTVQIKFSGSEAEVDAKINALKNIL